ncbi:hypothetical protein NTH_04271 (plasmid) [Nitratireductor thuwali]|uniref:TolC family protein n=2 Tax=Nitratireductor thuwali TaxID=2267699 RepID=A0ABY5MQL2_9HYPH|nr:hypothetical protein NTH_04271 [Nitratireductor thuwali]
MASFGIFRVPPAFLASLVFFAGCAGSPPPGETGNRKEPSIQLSSTTGPAHEAPYRTVRSSQKRGPASPDMAALLKRFPVNGSAPLRPIVLSALDRGAEVKAAALSLESQEANVSAAWSGYLPVVSSRVDYDPKDTRRGVRGQVEVSQKLVDWGGTAARVAEARAARDAAAEVHRQRQDQVALEAIAGYIDIRQFQRKIAVANDDIEALSRIAALAGERLEAGASDASERDLVRLRLDEARSVLEQERSNLAQALAAYRNRVGLSIDEAEALPYQADIFDGLDVEDLVAQAPSVVTRTLEAAGREEAAKAEQRALLPGVNAIATISTNRDFDDVDTTIGLRLQGPTFTGFSNFQRVEAARQAAAASRWTAETERNTLLRKVKSQIERVPFLDRQIRSIEKQIANAIELRGIYERQFVSAERSITDLLSVQSNVKDLLVRREDLMREAVNNQYVTLSDVGLLRAAVGL